MSAAANGAVTAAANAADSAGTPADGSPTQAVGNVQAQSTGRTGRRSRAADSGRLSGSGNGNGSGRETRSER